MSEKLYDVPAEWKKRAYAEAAKYQEMYARSIKDPNGFWAEQAKRIDWIKPFSKVKNTSFDTHNVSIKWFEDGTLNACFNCVDRHLAKRADQTAILWEGDDPKDDKKLTYKQLHAEVCRFANVLKARGVKKGDRVTIYMPMIPEAAISMLACARIGAIHSVVFGGFSPDSLAGRITDCKSDVVVTADEGVRGGRKIPLKANADAAADKAGHVTSMIVVRHTGEKVNMKAGRDVYYDEIAKTVPADCPCEPMNAEDPLFILYTSDKVQFGMGTYGSRSGAVGMSGIVKAIDKVVAKGKKVAAHMLEASEGDIEFKDGKFTVAGTDKSAAFGDVALNAYIAHKFSGQELEPGLKETSFYDPTNFTFPAGCHICEVEVDAETGKTDIVNWTAVDDFGTVINPMIVEGQVHGGIAQGVGQALLEGAVYDKDGQLVTGSFMDYTMPRAHDLPSFNVGLTETKSPSNPLGIKGCGEAGAIAAPAAVINAITDAIGTEQLTMPATASVVWQALQRAQPARQAAAE